VTIWAEVFLGIIAAATLAIAIVLVGVLVFAGRLARRIMRLADQVERELQPLVGHLNAIGRDASRAATLATAQIERADRLVADLGQRLEHILNLVQTSLVAPAREGRAVLAAFRAGLRAIRDLREHARAHRARAEDEDALFI
jgi:predicted PurR-regulated permease PerM